MLESLPYLGDFSELLIFETPRWVSLLLLSIPLMVLYNIPEEKKRSEGSRYGPEQLFGPMIAVLLGLSFLLPDEKLAPVFIVSILTFGSWKYGLINWFWINPLATYWALINLAELIDITDNYFTGYISFIAGLISMIQYYLLSNKVLYANISESFSHKNYHLDKQRFLDRLYQTRSYYLLETVVVSSSRLWVECYGCVCCVGILPLSFLVVQCVL